MRDGVELVADHYVPQTDHPVGHAAGPRSVRARLAVRRGCSARCTRRAAITCSSRACAARSARAATSTRSSTRSPTAPTRSPGCATSRGSPAPSPPSDCPIWDSPSGRCWPIPPPEMKAAVITVGPHDFSGPRWGTGSFALNDFLGWSDLVARQEDPRRVRLLLRQARAQRLVARLRLGLPLGEAGRALLGDGRALVRIVARAPDRPTTRSGRDCSFATRWTAWRSRCCCSAVGRTCSSTRRSSSTATCAAAA